MIQRVEKAMPGDGRSHIDVPEAMEWHEGSR